MIKHILCPIDLSGSTELAIRLAGSIATGLEARMTLLHVVESSCFTRGSESSATDVLQELHRRAERDLTGLAASSGNGVDTNVAEGDPYEIILDRVLHDEVDLLVMASRARSGIPRLVLGSLTEKVLDHIPIPVLIVPPARTLRYEGVVPPRTILMAIDFGIANATVMDASLELAKLWRTRLLALHVVPSPRAVFAGPGGSCWLSDDLLTELENRLKDVRRKQMAAVLRRVEEEAPDVEFLAVEGRPAETISRIIHERRVDLLVLGAHGHSTRPLGWIGSTCHQILHMGCCPTLIVKKAWPREHAAPFPRDTETSAGEPEAERETPHERDR